MAKGRKRSSSGYPDPISGALNLLGAVAMGAYARHKVKRDYAKGEGEDSVKAAMAVFGPGSFRRGTAGAVSLGGLFGVNSAIKDINICKDMSDRGFWVSNTSVTSIGVHEAAHGVEWALIQANRQYKSKAERTYAWNNCTEATRIVRDACANIKNTNYGHGKTSTELIRSISTYAIQNDSETMAEAFADVYANGDNAKPLSKEIKRLTRLFMDQYKGGV